MCIRDSGNTMKHFIKVLSILIISSMLSSIFQSLAHAEQDVVKIGEYTLSSSGFIVDYDGGDEKLVIPSVLDGRAVTGIGERCV